MTFLWLIRQSFRRDKGAEQQTSLLDTASTDRVSIKSSARFFPNNSVMFAYARPYGKLSASLSLGGKRLNMSVLITLLVVGLVVLYLRSNRKARSQWLQNLSLPGQWISQRDGGFLRLSGGLSGGEFQLSNTNGNDSGQWNYRGSTFTLRGQKTQIFTVQMFKHGVISLIRQDGTAELFHKQSTNVVALAKK